MYQAPQITGERQLSASLAEASNFQGGSDAEIKHGIQPVNGYETPKITERRDLTGNLVTKSYNPASDADVKHGVQPVRGYEAPQITEERVLNASTQFKSIYEK